MEKILVAALLVLMLMCQMMPSIQGRHHIRSRKILWGSRYHLMCVYYERPGILFFSGLNNYMNPTKVEIRSPPQTILKSGSLETKFPSEEIMGKSWGEGRGAMAWVTPGSGTSA